MPSNSGYMCSCLLKAICLVQVRLNGAGDAFQNEVHDLRQPYKRTLFSCCMYDEMDIVLPSSF